jgi:hypothetical protein
LCCGVLSGVGDGQSECQGKMISAVYLINLKGEILIYRAYRDDVSRAAADAFRMQVSRPLLCPPTTPVSKARPTRQTAIACHLLLHAQNTLIQ